MIAPTSASRPAEAIHVALAHVHGIVRCTLRRLVQDDPALHPAGEATNGQGACEIASSEGPDVLIIGTDFPDHSGAAVAQQVSSENQGTQVLVVSPHVDEETVAATVEAGVAGYLSTRENAQVVTETVRALAMGERKRFSREVADALVRSREAEHAAKGLDTLTPRECEVLRLMERGYSNGVIGDEAALSRSTVKKHVSSIYGKLDIRQQEDSGPKIAHPRVVAAVKAQRRDLP